MKTVKIGVMGVYRGTAMINFCKTSKNAKVVAICDKSEQAMAEQKKYIDDSVTCYSTFDEFIKHDMDAVVLANYANEHAPFAIRCLEAGKHAFSEVLPVQTMTEAVELVEAVERTGKIYAYGENYCYMPGPYRMKKLYREDKIGEFEYGECEYVHNCEPIWHSITYGERDHWRNNMYATFYCTHSIGPIIHMTGLRPVSVVGFEGPHIERNIRTGAKGGGFGLEMITLNNGGIIKSIHGGLYENSVWYSVYGSKGRMETARESARAGDVGRLYIDYDEYSGQYSGAYSSIDLNAEQNDTVAHFGHGGSDFFSMYNFVEKILGNPDADTIDVYEALDMFLPGMFAYRSVLNGNIPMEVPDLRDKNIRDKWRNDTMCTDAKAAGDQLIPSFSKGNPDIPDEVYDKMREKWLKELADDSGYVKSAFTQSSVDNS